MTLPAGKFFLLVSLFLSFNVNAQLRWIDSQEFDPEAFLYPHGAEGDRLLPVCRAEVDSEFFAGKVVNGECRYAIPGRVGSKKERTFRKTYAYGVADEFSVLVADSEEDYLWADSEDVVEVVFNGKFRPFLLSDGRGICKAHNLSLVTFKLKRRGWHPGILVTGGGNDDFTCFYEYGNSGDSSPAYEYLESRQMEILLGRE